MGPGALHQFTNGSQTRRKLRRGAKVLGTLRSMAPGGEVTAASLAQIHKVPLRTMQRTLTALTENGDVARSTLATAAGTIVLYRAVAP
jgi:hypothetical protein